MLMNLYPVFRTIIILCILFLITYALADGIRYENILGTALALASMVALGVCIYLFRKLTHRSEEEEQA